MSTRSVYYLIQSVIRQIWHDFYDGCLPRFAVDAEIEGLCMTLYHAYSVGAVSETDAISLCNYFDLPCVVERGGFDA